MVLVTNLTAQPLYRLINVYHISLPSYLAQLLICKSITSGHRSDAKLGSILYTQRNLIHKMCSSVHY